MGAIDDDLPAELRELDQVYDDEKSIARLQREKIINDARKDNNPWPAIDYLWGKSVDAGHEFPRVRMLVGATYRLVTQQVDGLRHDLYGKTERDLGDLGRMGARIDLIFGFRNILGGLLVIVIGGILTAIALQHIH